MQEFQRFANDDEAYYRSTSRMAVGVGGQFIVRMDRDFRIDDVPAELATIAIGVRSFVEKPAASFRSAGHGHIDGRHKSV
jgi:hypothetical protein